MVTPETRRRAQMILLGALALAVIIVAVTAVVNSLVVGLLVAGLSLVRGQYRPEKFGGGWSVLWQTTPASGQNAQRR